MDFVTIKNLILLPTIISFLIAFLITPISIKIAWKFHLIDDPKRRKHPAHLHKKTTPRGGGIPTFSAIFFSSILFLPLDYHLKSILLGAAILVIVGLLDDKYDINPYVRLVACSLSALIVVFSGIGIDFITNPFGGVIDLNQLKIQLSVFNQHFEISILADVLAIFWIVFLINIVNWSKGFDGQLPGIVFIASLTIAIFSLRYSADITQWAIAILASIVAGAYLGFLPYNFFPQKIMPGYGGGALAGFMLAVLTILSTSKILTSMVVLGIPIIDAVYSIIRRIASGRSPVWGDRGHLHHKILDKWHWGKRKTAIFYWLVTAVLGVFALCLSSKDKFYTIIMLFVVIGGLLLWFKYFSTSLNQSDQGNRSKT